MRTGRRQRSLLLTIILLPNLTEQKVLLRRPTYALSLKQPWAALVVGGLKSIEVRKWATSIRGRVYIHAARVPDKRPEGWATIPEKLLPLARLGGGVIGVAELFACVQYRTAAGFTADIPQHLNEPTWFESPRMYGFCFRGARTVPFHACKGNVRFFTVDVKEAT